MRRLSYVGAPLPNLSSSCGPSERGSLNRRIFPLDALLAIMRDVFKGIIGSPDAIVEQIKAYGAAGVEELVGVWGNEDIEGLLLLAEEVLPHL
jgi:alkanesulfonate monooxygenase SsuD/methylene tetrahydromethanopterin reductase-like flavin-dependent oxidoreductase (luciferase family)